VQNQSSIESRNNECGFILLWALPDLWCERPAYMRCVRSFHIIFYLMSGGKGDSKAFAASLQQYTAGLPQGFYMAADNAYTLSDTLLIPYSGVDKLDPSKDVFNFYLLQLRIQIEQAFGLLVSKWRIFKKVLEVKLFRVGHIVQACARLHNYCINNRDDNIPVISRRDPETFCPNY
jgi:hypothetical protein